MLGLFFTTVGILLLEILDSRLLSVLTWYHLAFFAVSLAMIGMAAGAVFVFVAGERYAGARAVRELPRMGLALALAIPLSHILNLYLPIPLLDRFSLNEIGRITLATLVLG